MTKPGQELRALSNVRRQGFGPYLPRYYDRECKRRRPLFPRYLFVSIPDDQTRWGSLFNTFGIQRVISNLFNRHLLLVLEKRICELKASENVNGVVELPDRPTYAELHRHRKAISFQIGQKVRIKAGMLAGNIGLYQGQTVQQREKVLLSWLGEALISLDDLEDAV